MTIREELELFIERTDELIDGKYILADIKIVNLLKVIASSDTLLALFKNCLTDFDYETAQKKYLVKNQYLSAEKGEFVLPPNSRELLAFIFTVLVDIDAKRINLGEFINKYFFVDGSFSSGYDAFVTAMIKPFRNTVKMLVEGVIDGSIQDPIEALDEEEARREKQRAIDEVSVKKEKEILKKVKGNSVQFAKKLLLEDKQKIKDSRLSEEKKQEAILVIDMMANVVDSEDKDAINYAFTAYKYMARVHKILFSKRIKKMSALLKDISNEL